MHQLDVLLIDFVTKKMKGKHATRNAEFFFSHLPVSEEHGEDKTLVEIGSTYNLTRESVRQIIMRICNKLKGEKDIMLRLESLMSELDTLCPVSVDYANNYFIEKGIIKSPCITALVKIYQKVILCSNIRYLPTNNVFENKKNEGMVQCIYSYVIKKVVKNGAVGMHELIERFGDIAKDDSTMASLLLSMDGIKKLPSDYYYFGHKGRNRLIHRLTSLFNTYTSVDMKNIEPAIERCWKADVNKEVHHAEATSRLNTGFKFFTQVVPASVIRFILEECGIARVEGDVAFSLIKSQEDLRWIEREILLFIKDKGGEEREKNIENHIISLDPKKRFSCMQFISASPLLINPRRGYYRLTGDM